MTGLRVEVNGQVLSQGGDVAADQLEDTKAETHSRSGYLHVQSCLLVSILHSKCVVDWGAQHMQGSDALSQIQIRGSGHCHKLDGCDLACRASADFLPVAFVLGLAPGKATEVPIVIVAEDGVTSLRYYLNIFRADAPKNSTGSSSASSWSLGSSAYLGSDGAPSGSLDLRSGGRGIDAKESMPPSVLRGKAARQPGTVSSTFAPHSQVHSKFSISCGAGGCIVYEHTSARLSSAKCFGSL